MKVVDISGRTYRACVKLLPAPAPDSPAERAAQEAQELEAYAWRDLRRRVNDEQALADMTDGVPRNVPRGTHLPIRRPAPHSGEVLLLIGMLIGTLIVIGLLIASWPPELPLNGCTP